MNISKSVTGNQITLVLEGWLDTQAAPELESAIAEIPGDAESLVIDMEKLEYISSSGVRQIVAAHKKMGGNLVVHNAPQGIFSVFEATGINKKIRFE